ncbi:MAG: exodeoxyribonuclease VII large subunit [Proteobacteria bacterium]|nr:MAG: exodeoxyribonuclease VII large subunit [Pseudomonadota bacterium]
MQSVSELTQQIKSLLESTFLHVRVKGEVSRPTYHSSGHLYFTLKDDKSSISCVMFRGNNQKLKFCIEDGMEVDVSASISVYPPRGSYQLNCVSLEPSGSGALALAYKQLKEELYKKGYFEQKRPLPSIPKHIALVTSKTGAALQDMLNVANARFPLVKISLFNTLVQGDEAKYHIAKAIEQAQKIAPDLIVISRGGGSVEDLWAFNEREVAEAIFASNIPTISAVGHAIDTPISDFVADASAPTPSAAMEMILPDINELRQSIDNTKDLYDNLILNRFANYEQELNHLKNQFSFLSPKTKIGLVQEEVKNLKSLYILALKQKLNFFSSSINALDLAFKNKNPENILKNGYAQITKNGKIVNLQNLKKNDEFMLHDNKRSIKAKTM